MDQRAKAIIAVLGATVAVLLVALVVVIFFNPRADSTGARGMGGMGGMSPGGMSGSYSGMMQAMGGMDTDAMLARMREVLGEEGYQQMLAHMRDHRAGSPAGTPPIDGMMHQMMDGMMGQMPMDRGGMLRPGSTPAPSGTATR